LVQEREKVFNVLGYRITPQVVDGIIQEASEVQWGTHLLRWRYFDVTHEGVVYHQGSLIPTDLWHLLKRIYVDQDWPVGTTMEQFNQDARSTIQDPETKIYVYGYYRTDPPRIQWGFLNSRTGIAVVYDMEADRIATVFKPEEGEAFFLGQIDGREIDRKEFVL
jgi:hypothetical protein